MDFLRPAVLAAFLFASAGAAHALRPEIVDSWKTACKDNRYSCCQAKVRECKDGCGGGNAGQSCRNDCASGYNGCIKKMRVPNNNPVKTRPPTKAQ